MENENKAQFSIDSLTIGELCDLEEVSGLSFDQMNFNKLTGKMALAIAWILEKRNNPKFTLSEAKNMKVIDLTALTTGKSQSVA